VANLKGGAGKSTAAINLAAAAQTAGIQAAIIDVDPDQQAAARWGDARATARPPVLSAVHSRLPQAIAEAERGTAAPFPGVQGPSALPSPPSGPATTMVG